MELRFSINLLTNISSEEAAKLVDTCPCYVVSNVSLDEFLIIKGYFSDVNATVECEEMLSDEFLSIPPLSPTFFKQWKSCPTCGKDVSKNAYTCPFCGYTFAQQTDEAKDGLGFGKIVGAVIVASYPKQRFQAPYSDSFANVFLRNCVGVSYTDISRRYSDRCRGFCSVSVWRLVVLDF